MKERKSDRNRLRPKGIARPAASSSSLLYSSPSPSPLHVILDGDGERDCCRSRERGPLQLTIRSNDLRDRSKRCPPKFERDPPILPQSEIIIALFAGRRRPTDRINMQNTSARTSTCQKSGTSLRKRAKFDTSC